MERKVICVGTIWDLDEWVYPELDDYSGLTGRNFRQLAAYQLTSSKNEKKNVVKLPLFPRNQYGIRVRACCASCSLKKITNGGRRMCAFHRCQVEPLEKCRHWQMAEALMGVGLTESSRPIFIRK